jgi:hypothetical protein
MDARDCVMLRAQNCLRSVPVVVLGSGYSVGHGLPSMSDLGAHLQAVVTPPTAHKQLWEGLRNRLLSENLETVLQVGHVPPDLSLEIVHRTRELILARDCDVFAAMISDRNFLPLSRLYRYLFQSTHRSIAVVTTNYDRLAEYAADVCDFGQRTGFGYGYLRHREATLPWRLHLDGQPARTVEIWKVHGSVDWFRDSEGTAFAAPLLSKAPDGVVPAMVTPGLTKYEETYQEPFRTILRNADAALERAPGYFCVGFGFNDAHIQPKLVERARKEAIPIVVLARALTPSAKSFLLQGDGLEFLALEASATGTRAYCTEAPEGVDLVGDSLWNLGDFLDAVTTE